MKTDSVTKSFKTSRKARKTNNDKDQHLNPLLTLGK